jgi:stage II sporulation protein D
MAPAEPALEPARAVAQRSDADARGRRRGWCLPRGVGTALGVAIALILGPGPPWRAEAGEEIRVALLDGASTVDVGGAPLLVRDLASRRVVGANVSWLRIRVGRSKTLVLHAPGARPRLVASGRVRLLAPSGQSVRMNSHDYPGAVEVMTIGEGLLVINEVALEDYLPGVVKAEAGDAMPLEMLKAQAVVARTYAAYHRHLNAGRSYHVGSTTAYQQYAGRVAPGSPAWLAVRETAGQVLVWQGALFPAFYHTDSGGHTEDPRVVYDSARMPALQPVRVAFASESPYREWSLDLPLTELTARLRRGGVVVGPIHDLEVLERSPSTRVSRIAVHSTQGRAELLGNEFRRLVGYDLLKSTLFDVVVDGGLARFTGRGYGHGIGLDQARAKTMADLAYRAPEILAYFYPGAELSTLGRSGTLTGSRP